MTEHLEEHSEESETQEYLVVELESEEGKIEEFVVFETCEVDSNQYALLVPLAKVQALEEEEVEDAESDDLEESTMMLVLRFKDDEYFELTDEEFEKVRVFLDEKLA